MDRNAKADVAQLLRTELVTAESVAPLSALNVAKILPLTTTIQRKSALRADQKKQTAQEQKVTTTFQVCLQSRQKEIHDWYKFFE